MIDTRTKMAIKFIARFIYSNCIIFNLVGQRPYSISGRRPASAGVAFNADAIIPFIVIIIAMPFYELLLI